MLICGIALLLTNAAVLIYDISTFKSGMVKELTTLARIIGNNSTAAIVFDDKDTAKEILSALKAKTHITTASLLVNNTPIATYNRDNIQPFTPTLFKEGFQFEPDDLDLYQDIYFKNKKIGAVYIESDLKEVESRLKNYFVTMVLVILIVSIIAFLITSRLQRLISDPILQLAQTTQNVSKTQNYSVQIQKHSNDEIGQLFDGFNQMMKQIQSRDAQLIEAQNKLEHRVLERTEDLRETNAELAASEKQLRKTLLNMEFANKELENAQHQLLQSEKMASIGQLAAGVAHEINNPIGFISNNMEILRDYVHNYTKILQCTDKLKQTIIDNDLTKAKNILDELKNLEQEINLDYMKTDVTTLLEHSSKGFERIKKIVTDLRTFAREEKNETMELFNVEEILDSVLNIVYSELKYKAELKKEYSNTPAVLCSPQRIGQVFINLLVNATQAIKDKGEIKIRTYTQDGYVAIDIADTGSGIPAENFQKIFDPFFTTKPVGRGTGLGLSISYGIVKKHGGDIQVTSKVGEGSTFTVRLPLPA